MTFFKNDTKLWDDLSFSYSETLKNSVTHYNWYHNELIPRVLGLVKGKKSVLDFGCGDGTLTDQIAHQGSKVVGYDISKGMIEIGNSLFPKLDLRSGDMNKILGNTSTYDAIVANMVLHDIKDFPNVLEKLDTLLKKNGTLIFSIPHPCFYTETGKEYFDQKKSLLEVKKYKTPHSFFKFQSNRQPGVRHYHRPLTDYFKNLFELGYTTSYFEEIFEKNKNAEVPFSVLFAFSKKK